MAFETEIYECIKDYGQTEEDINYFMSQAIASHIGGKTKIDTNNSNDPIDGYSEVSFDKNVEFITISGKNLNIDVLENQEQVTDIELFDFNFNLTLTVAEANMKQGKMYTTFYINKQLFENEAFIESIQKYYNEKIESGDLYNKEENDYDSYEYDKVDIEVSILKEKPKKKRKVSSKQDNTIK